MMALMRLLSFLVTGQPVLFIGDRPAAVESAIAHLPTGAHGERRTLILQVEPEWHNFTSAEWSRMWNLAVLRLIRTHPSIGLHVPFSFTAVPGMRR